VRRVIGEGELLTLDKRLPGKPQDGYPQTFFVLAGIVALLTYLGIAWFVFPLEAIWSPDTGAKFLQLKNLRWENGCLAFDIQYPGRAIDPSLQFATREPGSGLLVVRSDKLQFQRLPIFPLLSWPGVQGLGFRGLYLLPALGGAASGILALHLLRRRDRRVAMWILIAFGSPIYIYSTLFWEHTTATALTLFGAWLSLRGPSPYASWLRQMLIWTAVGIIMAFGAYIRLETAIFALAWLLALWLIDHSGRWGPIWAGGVLGLSMLPYRPLHGMLFAGQEMPGHAEYLFYPFQYLISAKWSAVPDLLIGPQASGSLHTGWLGALWAMAAIVVGAHSVGAHDTPAKRIVRRIGSAITIIIGARYLFTDVSYHSAHGLLFTTPWAILGMSRAYRVWRSGDRRAQVVVLTNILGLIGYTIGIIGFRGSSPHGGLEWGARFAMSFYPLLALVAAWDLGTKRKDILTLTVIGALLFLGLGFQARGLWTIKRDMQNNATLNQIILELPEKHIVSDLEWLPLNTAPIYDQKQIFVTDTAEELNTWAHLAAEQDVEHFAIVTLDDTLLKQTDKLTDEQHLDTLNHYYLQNFQIYQMRIRTD
jgi:hypothetical protein